MLQHGPGAVADEHLKNQCLSRKIETHLCGPKLHHALYLSAAFGILLSGLCAFVYAHVCLRVCVFCGDMQYVCDSSVTAGVWYHNSLLSLWRISWFVMCVGGRMGHSFSLPLLIIVGLSLDILLLAG